MEKYEKTGAEILIAINDGRIISQSQKQAEFDPRYGSKSLYNY